MTEPEEQNIFIPIHKEFWNTFSSIVLDGEKVNEEKFNSNVRDGWVYRMWFRLKGGSLKRATMIHLTFGTINLENNGWCVDGVRGATDVVFVKKTGEEVRRSAKDLLNALIQFYPEYGHLLRAHGWPIDGPNEKEIDIFYHRDPEVLRWIIWGYNDTDEMVFHLSATEPKMRNTLMVLMSARQELTHWEIHHKVWIRDKEEKWKLWDELPQHTYHTDWRKAKRFDNKRGGEMKNDRHDSARPY